MTDTDLIAPDAGRAPSGQALVSDQAASRLAPSGFDPSREQALMSIIRDTLWMACRYAHGRQSYAVGMYNEAARRAVALGAVEQGVETFALDGTLSAPLSGLTHQEFAMAYHNWSSPNAIRTHVPRRDSDGNPKGGDGTAPSRSDDSAGRETASPDSSAHAAQKEG